jgi:protein-S-isoprenylcysteine O-methyltransferase Ste14
VFATEAICGAVIKPAIFVFATKPEMFAEAAKPPKFLLTAIVILRYFILLYLLMVEVLEQASLK